jgi:L-asparaginase
MIHIITTGGTIEGLDYIDNEGITKSNVSIEDFLERANVDFEYSIENAFKKDSRSITKDDRELLVSKINQSNATNILISHGTYTMEVTAKYLGKLNLNKTIVLVGSFILGSSNNTDAPFNLGYAISSLQLLKPNVYVAMNGQTFLWNNVSKNIETKKFERNE